MVYATTVQLSKFMNIMRHVPDVDTVGSSRAREEIGTGDASTTVFWFDYARIVAGTYTITYAASETGSHTTLTETTHYTVDKDLGKLTLTAAGVTAVSTNKIFGAYSYIHPDVGVNDTQLSESIDRAEDQIDDWTNNHFAVSSDTTPDWNQVLDEIQDGEGVHRRGYFTSQNYPLPSVSTLLNGAVLANDTTITVDSTNGFPSSGYIQVETEKIQYTGKSSTTFTGCTSVSAHADNSTVKPDVVEMSTTEPGGTISWTVLEEGIDFDIDRKTGRVHMYASGQDYNGTYVDVEQYPLRGVANRVRFSYISGQSSIPDAIKKATLMLAAKDIMSMTVRKSHTAGLNKFNPGLLNVDMDELKSTLAHYRNEQSLRV